MATTLEGVELDGLPFELKGFGQPDAVYPARFGNFNSPAVRAALLAGGVLMFLTGGAAIFGYFNVPFPKDGPPAEIVLGVGLFALAFGLVLVVAAPRHASDKIAGQAFSGFLLYPTALVRVKDGSCTIFAWDQVEALINPDQGLANYQVLSSDGRKFPVDRSVKRYFDLIGEIRDRVKHERLDGIRRKIASGHTVMFGPFGVSRDALQYKGKRLAWDEMSVFEVVLVQGHRYLRVKRRGTIWPWSYRPLYGLPNDAMFLTLVEDIRSGRPRVWS